MNINAINGGTKRGLTFARVWDANDRLTRGSWARNEPFDLMVSCTLDTQFSHGVSVHDFTDFIRHANLLLLFISYSPYMCVYLLYKVMQR